MLSWKFLNQALILVSGMVVTAWLLGLGHLWLQLLLVGSVSTLTILACQENFHRVQKRFELWLFNRTSLNWKKWSLKSERKKVQAEEQLLIIPVDGELVKPKRRGATPRAVREAEEAAGKAYKRFFP
jgi:hypothetical protein